VIRKFWAVSLQWMLAASLPLTNFCVSVSGRDAQQGGLEYSMTMSSAIIGEALVQHWFSSFLA
jgi:hypothetical protein